MQTLQVLWMTLRRKKFEESVDPSSSSKKGILEFHKELRHPSPNITKSKATAHNIMLTNGSLEKLTSYVIAKLCQSKTRKDVKDYVQDIKFFIDISSPKTRTLIGYWHWLLIVDEALYMCWSYFLKKKMTYPRK